MKNKYLILCLMLTNIAFAQQKNKYGYPLSIISDVETYLKQVAVDSNQTLVEIKSRIPNIVLDIRYATTNNFLNKVFYKEANAFARLPVVKALQAVQDELNKQGLGVKNL